jgi:methyltransferase family protein
VSIGARVRGRLRQWRSQASEATAERAEWGFQRAVSSRHVAPLNRYQQAFCDWNAQRLAISPEESRARFESSMRTFRGGHAGLTFRTFNDISHSLYSVFANDSATEVYDAYRLHAPAHFLRQLSHGEPAWPTDHPVVAALRSRPEATIIDFGCGLAQASVSLADRLRSLGVEPTLVLADIPTLRFDFLAWLVEQWGFEARLHACTPETPVPELEPCDVLIAREFFEHVYDPVAYLDQLDKYVRPGGFVVTNVSDHHAEFMHVSPDLRALRDRFTALGYRDLARNKVLQKTV